MRKWELIKQSKPLRIKSKIFLNLFNEKYGLKLGEFKNTTGTARVKVPPNIFFEKMIFLFIVCWTLDFIVLQH